MSVQQTSLEAYRSIVDKLPEKRLSVFTCIEQFGPVTAYEIAEILHWPINCVSGRLTEIKAVKPDIIRFAGMKTINGRNHMAFKAILPETLF